MNEWIEKLANASADVRRSAAAELYSLGRSWADAATAAWRTDAELASLLLPAPTVGIAVSPQHFESIRAANGSPRLADVPPEQDAMEFELHFGGGVRLDILTTRAPAASGAIAQFLRKLGEGIQQVEYETTNVDRAVELLRAKRRVEAVYPQTRPGADGTRVNFFLASAPDGRKVLIELYEVPKTGDKP
ncbi:MAG: hypothetical protein ACRD50_15945 [Candidatus Acidiferrales bacterium]